MPIFALLILFSAFATYELYIKEDREIAPLPPLQETVIIQTREDVTKEIFSQNDHLLIHSNFSILELSHKNNRLAVQETLFNLHADLPNGSMDAEKLVWNQKEGIAIEGLSDVHFTITLDNEPLLNNLFEQYL
jgi:hypothetical protein